MNNSPKSQVQASPLRILTQSGNAASLTAALAIPHVLRTFQNYRDEEIRPRLAETDALISTRFNASWLGPQGSPLRLIHSLGAGTESIDFSAVPSQCKVCNVYGHEHAIAEHVFMTMLALNRGLFIQDAALR